MSKPIIPKDNLQKPTTRDDLLRLVLEPLSRQMNQSWLQLHKKIGDLQVTIEIIARELARQKQSSNNPAVESKIEEHSTQT